MLVLLSFTKVMRTWFLKTVIYGNFNLWNSYEYNYNPNGMPVPEILDIEKVRF